MLQIQLNFLILLGGSEALRLAFACVWRTRAYFRGIVMARMCYKNTVLYLTGSMIIRMALHNISAIRIDHYQII